MAGFQTRVGMALEAPATAQVWPSTAAAPVTTLLPVTAEGLSDRATLVHLATRGGAQSLTRSHVVARNALAPLTPVAHYGDLEPLWALALGYMPQRLAGMPYPEELATGVYRHRYEVSPYLHSRPWGLDDGFLLDQRLARRATIAAWRGGVSVSEAVSAMVQSLTLSGEANNQPLTLSVQLLAHSVRQDSAVNTPEVLAALPRPASPRVLWHHGVQRLKPFSTEEALSDSDTLRTDKCTQAIANGLPRVPGRLGGLATDEPYRPQAVRISGTLQQPLYEDDTLALAQRAAGPYMMDWRWTGREIGATGLHYQLACYFPSVWLEQVESASKGSGRIPVATQFTATEAPAAAAGFPDTMYQTALLVEIVSSAATHSFL